MQKKVKFLRIVNMILIFQNEVIIKHQHLKKIKVSPKKYS